MRLQTDRSSLRILVWLVLVLSGISTSYAAPVMGFVPHAAGSYRLEPIQRASDGRVLDAHGAKRRLSEFTQGRVTLLAFMYASCADPNGCPYAMTVMHEVKDALEDIARAHGRVRYISMSFDPVRDTPEALAHNSMGMAHADSAVEWQFLTTRSRKELLPILNGYGQDVGVNVEKVTGKPTGTYSHVLKLFLIDKHSVVREIYTTDYLLPDVVLNDIKTLLLEDGVALK